MLIYEGFFLKKCDLFQLFQFAKSELEQVFPCIYQAFLVNVPFVPIIFNLKRERKEYRKGSIYVCIYKAC